MTLLDAVALGFLGGAMLGFYLGLVWSRKVHGNELTQTSKDAPLVKPLPTFTADPSAKPTSYLVIPPKQPPPS